MINKNLISKYEYILFKHKPKEENDNKSLLKQTYQELAIKFGFNLSKINALDDYYFIPDVTKENFGILFIDMHKFKSIDISPCRDIITIRNKEIIPNTKSPFLLIIRYPNDSSYKYFGCFQLSNNSNKKYIFSQYSPTYYKNRNTTQFIY